MSEKAGRNARPKYRQQLLSGWSGFGKPENWHGDSTQEEQPEATEVHLTKQKAYHVSIPVIIEPVSVSGNELQYKICIYDDLDLSVSPFSTRGKRPLAPTIGIPGEKSSRAIKIPMVYGVYENGDTPLSHTNKSRLFDLTASIYSAVLGAIDTAIERAIFDLEKQAANDDTGERIEGASTPKSLGDNTASGRSKKVLPKVLSETLPKESTGLDEDNG